MHIDAAILPVGKKSKKIKTKQNGAKAVKAFAVEIEEKPQPAKKGLKSKKLLENNKPAKEVDTAVRAKVREGTKNIDKAILPDGKKSKKTKTNQNGAKAAETFAVKIEEKSQPAKKGLKSKMLSESNKPAVHAKVEEGTKNIDAAIQPIRKRSRKRKSEKKIINNEDVKADDGQIDEEGSATVGNSQPAKKKRKSDKSSENNAFLKKIATALSVEVEEGTEKKLRKNRKKAISKNEPSPDRQVLLIEECTTYLKNWKENKSNWKFDTRLQKWLIQFMLDDSCVSDDIFPIFLEYIAGAKGIAIEQVTERAKQAIENAEENETDADDPTLVRARALIQAVVVD